MIGKSSISSSLVLIWVITYSSTVFIVFTFSRSFVGARELEHRDKKNGIECPSSIPARISRHLIYDFTHQMRSKYKHRRVFVNQYTIAINTWLCIRAKNPYICSSPHDNYTRAYQWHCVCMHTEYIYTPVYQSLYIINIYDLTIAPSTLLREWENVHDVA